MIYSRTTKKFILPLLLLSVVLAGCVSTTKSPTTLLTPTIISESTAIKTIKNIHTELKDYPSDVFPSRSISAQKVDNGWYVAFIQE